jgi:hypothetical protein
MLKKKFGVYGEMKSFFDLISTRGILFITYVGARELLVLFSPGYSTNCRASLQYDIRAAVAARDGMQGFDVEGRPVSLFAPDTAICERVL